MDRIEKLRDHLCESREKQHSLTFNATNAEALEARKLLGKVAIVTGAGSGIGAATSVLFARHGAKVVVSDINLDNAKNVCQEINMDHPGSAIAVKCDVSKKEDTKNMVDKAVSEFGQLDIFFANAGILNKFVPIADEEEETFMKTMQINTLGAFMAIKYAGDAIAKTAGGGSIVCTASIAALRADLTPLQYAASKGAILSMVTSANDRMLLEGVRVNAVVPGGVVTPLAMNVAQNLDDQGLYLKDFDYRRFPPNTPEEISQVVLFLASDDSIPIKGQAIIADGAMINSMASQPRPVRKKK